MAEESSGEDSSLLRRLNALKPTSVQLEQRKKPLDFSRNPPDFDLLGPHLLGRKPASSASIPQVPSPLDPVAEYDAVPASFLMGGDAIEEMLSSLEHHHERMPDLAPSDVTLDAARDFKPQQAHKNSLLDGLILDEPTPDLKYGLKPYISNRAGEYHDGIPVADNKEDEDAEDEEKASEYVERLLAQISSEDKDRSPARLSETNASGGSFDVIKSSGQESDDQSLDARFAALNLPSVPDLAPQKGGPRARRNAEDEAEPKCCCICFDNPTTKCSDCEEGSQLFCTRCWWEMHVDSGDGDDAFSRHRKVSLQDR